MRTFKYIAMLLLLSAVSYMAEAQQFTKKKRYWSAGLTLSAMNYFGDIVPKQPITSFDIKFTKPTLGGYVQRRLTPNISLRAGFAYGVLKGDDDTSASKGYNKGEDDAIFRVYRNLHFRNRITEISGVAVFDLIQNRGMFYQRSKKPIPYIFIGLGAVYSNPQAKTPVTDTWTDPVATETWVSLRPLKTEGKSYSPLVISIPTGIGVKYKISNKIDVGFEMGYRWTLSDYMDDVSGRYYGGHPTGSLASVMADRSLEPLGSLFKRDRSIVISEIRTRYTDPKLYSKPYQEGVFYGERRGNDGTPYDNPDAKLSLINKIMNNDIYIVYGFNASYVIAPGVKCPKFR